MIKVSDHAVVRYLERVEGLDVEATRQAIACSLDSPTARELVEFSGGFPCKVTVDGKGYFIRQKTVTTCVPTEWAARRKKRR